METARLRLRPFAADLSDVDALHGSWAIPSRCGGIRSRSTGRRPADGSSGSSLVTEPMGTGLLAIEDKHTGELLGDCGPSFQDVDGERLLELGWHVLRARQGQGIATEAGEACRDWAFTSMAEPSLISLIRPENVPSRRVAEKLGFEIWRGTIRAGWGHLVYRLDAPVTPA